MMNGCYDQLTVVNQHDVHPTSPETYYRSVMCMGKVKILDGAEYDEMMMKFAQKLSPYAAKPEVIYSTKFKMCVYTLKIEEMSGKVELSVARIIPAEEDL